MKEIWKPVNGYENLYAVSNYGHIKSYRTHKTLSPVKTNTGYYRITLCKNRIKKHYYIHRIVADSFLCKNNQPIVNHKDGNKMNNRVNNLEWCNYKYNTKHSINILGNEPGKTLTKKVQCIETNMIFPSLCKAAKYYKGSSSNLCNLLNGKNRSKTFAGYHWKYC